jgi:hypothetical protein
VTSTIVPAAFFIYSLPLVESQAGSLVTKSDAVGALEPVRMMILFLRGMTLN